MSSSLSSLLTANERHAFDSFLSDVGAEDLALPREWQLYSNLAPPHADGTDALSKATKDLIALHPPPKFPAQQRPIAPAPPTHIAPPPRASTSRVVPPPPLPSTSTSRSASPARKRPRSASPTPATKSTLLTAQQKKANHIQSEQKRRANIRRGYEALCETVPALREAGEDTGAGAGAGAGAGGSARGRRKRARTEDGADGRAGPRSESIVLQKTIEHIQGLLDEKSALQARLERARVALGDGHPALYSHAYAQGQPVWERDWDGGKGAMIEGDDEDSDYDD